jgi:DNA repair exonuclease SbcCD ATPase subunit
MPETFEIPLNTVTEWLNKETTPIVEPLKAEAKKLLEDLQNKLEDLSESCEKLLEDAEKEMAKGSRKTYRRAKFLYKLAGTFSDLIAEVIIPEEINAKILNETSEQIGKTLKKIEQEKTKWFRAISPYFIISRRRFDVSSKRVNDSFQNFTDFLSDDYAKAARAENVSSDVEMLRQSLAELDKSDKAKEARKQKKQLLEKKITKNQQKLQAIQSTDEVVELAQLNARIEELTEIVKHELRHVQKPLLKFQTLVNSPGYSLFPEATSKLDEYLTNSFEALATEKEEYLLLKSILQKIDAALDNKKMKLKSSRLRKAKDQIDRIVNKAALVPLQNDCSEAFNKKRELSKSGVINASRNEKAELQERLKELQRRISLLEARDARFGKQHEEARRKVDEQKRSLEEVVSELSSKKVQILID